MIKKLIEQGIDIEFEIKNIKYSISKSKTEQLYYIETYERFKYIGFAEYESLDEIKCYNWNEVESYISNLIDNVKK